MNTPNQYHPNMIPEKEVKANGLICFLNNQRSCGPDCMAFTDPPEGDDYRGKQWANCMLLVSAHRGGKHLTILASQGAELVKQNKKTSADAQRVNQPPPPVVK